MQTALIVFLVLETLMLVFLLRALWRAVHDVTRLETKTRLLKTAATRLEQKLSEERCSCSNCQTEREMAHAGLAVRYQ